MALHKHQNSDEIFYCIKGSRFGVLENEGTEMNAGDHFILKENTMHVLRSDSEMWVVSLLTPIISD